MVHNQCWEQRCQEKWIPPKSLYSEANLIREQGKKIVTINGSFDLLHSGHLHMLFEASQLGDCLIVLLNSDRSVKQYKASDRPIVSLKDRLQMLSAIGFVDWVSYFDDLTPISVLSLIQPDIHVNGDEYGYNCIEKDVVEKGGGRIHIVKKVRGLSTTRLINKIQSLHQTCVT